MNIEEQLQALSRQTCPRQVDVVDAVMAEVRQHPYLQPVAPRRNPWIPRIALTAVAAVAALVIINVSTSRSYDMDQIGSMMAYVSDYDNYTVEHAANPIEYLYDDDTYYNE